MANIPNGSPQFGKQHTWRTRRIIVSVVVAIVIVGAIPLAIALKGKPSAQASSPSSLPTSSSLPSAASTWPNSDGGPTTNAVERTTTLPTGKYANTSMCGAVNTKAQTVEQMLASITTGGVSPAQLESAFQDLEKAARNQASTSSGQLQTVLNNLADTVSRFRNDMMNDNNSSVNTDTTNLANAYASFLNACRS